MNFFGKNTKLDEIRKLENEYTSTLFSYSEKEYKNKLEELLYTLPNKDVQIKDFISEKDITQIEILLLLSKLKNNSTEENVMYLKEAINYGSLKAGINFLKNFCHIYPEDSIKIFNLLNTYPEEKFFKEVFKKEELKDKLKNAQQKYFDSLNKDYFNYLKLIYLNSFIGISYLKLNRIKLAEKHLKIATENALNITDETIVSIPIKSGLTIALFNLGIINYKRKNFEEAKKYFQRCNLKEKDAYYFLATIALEENDIVTAIYNFMKDNSYSAKRNIVILKLKHFFSYNTITECISILEKEGSLITDDNNLLGELYLLKKEHNYDFEYKENACYLFANTDNFDKLNYLLTKGISENNLSILNGLALIRDRIRGVKEITDISIKASNKLKEIESFTDTEDNLVLENYFEQYQFKYNPNMLED